MNKLFKNFPWYILAAIFLFSIFKVKGYEGLIAGSVIIFFFGQLS